VPTSDPGSIALGWFVVPGLLGGLLGSVVAAAWTHFSQKDLRLAESRLLKQEESFRIAHSPRVATAIELWTALREYERALVAHLDPIQRVKMPAGTSIDGLADMTRLSDAHSRAQRAELQRTWLELAKTRDKAEVILPPSAFTPFDEMFAAYFRAFEMQRTMAEPGLTVDSIRLCGAARDRHLAVASKLHPSALIALQALMGPEVT